MTFYCTTPPDAFLYNNISTIFTSCKVVIGLDEEPESSEKQVSKHC